MLPHPKMSITGVCTICSFTHSKITGLHFQLLPNWMYLLLLQPKRQRTCLLPNPHNERERWVNDLKSYTFKNQRAPLSAHSKVNVLVGVIAEKRNSMLIALFKKWVPTEPQGFLAWHLAISKGCAAICTHNHNIGCLSRRKCGDNIATTS